MLDFMAATISEPIVDWLPVFGKNRVVPSSIKDCNRVSRLSNFSIMELMIKALL
jgi:hypothetical protein